MKYQCPVCTTIQTFSNLLELMNHINREHIGLPEMSPEYRYACPACVETFIELPELVKHINIIHIPLGSDVPYPVSMKEFARESDYVKGLKSIIRILLERY